MLAGQADGNVDVPGHRWLNDANFLRAVDVGGLNVGIIVQSSPIVLGVWRGSAVAIMMAACELGSAASWRNDPVWLPVEDLLANLREGRSRGGAS